MMWKHVLLEITFFSFLCQHKYLSKPVSGVPSLLCGALMEYREKKSDGGEEEAAGATDTAA